MKDKEKQIEELVNKLEKYCTRAKCKAESCAKCRAKYLIEKGYQKVDKDQVVVLKTEYERLIYVEGELQELNADYYNELKELKDSLKDSVVLPREEYDNLKLEIQQAHNKGVRAGFDLTRYKENSIEQARKETAREILSEIRGYYPIDLEHCDKGEAFILELCYELAKQYGVEIKE